MTNETELLECLCFRLRKATRMVSQTYDRALEPIGLTNTQFNLLAHLPKARQLPVGDLAREVGADATTLTRLLQPLVRRGLVQIIKAPYDARVRLVMSTGPGRTLLERAIPAWRQAQAHMKDRLSKDAMRHLESGLEALLHARNDR